MKFQQGGFINVTLRRTPQISYFHRGKHQLQGHPGKPAYPHAVGLIHLPRCETSQTTTGEARSSRKNSRPLGWLKPQHMQLHPFQDPAEPGLILRAFYFRCWEGNWRKSPQIWRGVIWRQKKYDLSLYHISCEHQVLLKTQDWQSKNTWNRPAALRFTRMPSIKRVCARLCETNPRPCPENGQKNVKAASSGWNTSHTKR